MGWYHETLGRNRVVLEQSKAIYTSQWEAQWAGYQRFRDRQVTDRSLGPVIGNIRARCKED
jgi:hypothetical protein